MSDRFTYSEADKENQRQVQQVEVFTGQELRRYHDNWASFWQYLDNYCSEFGVNIGVEFTISVKKRNTELSNSKRVASGKRTVELLPDDLEAYRRTFICHRGRSPQKNGKKRRRSPQKNGKKRRRSKTYTGCKFKFKATSVNRDGAWQVEIIMMNTQHDHTQKSAEIQREHKPAEESGEESQSSVMTTNTSVMASSMSDQRDASTFSTAFGEDPTPEPTAESNQHVLACNSEEIRQLLLELDDGDTGQVLIEPFSSPVIDCFDYQLPGTAESVSSQHWSSETSGEDTISLAPTSEASVYDVDENDPLLAQLSPDQLQLQFPPVSSSLNDEWISRFVEEEKGFPPV